MAHPHEILKKVVERIAAEQKIDNFNISIRQTSSDGANFMSILHKATISSPNAPDLKLFAKLGTLPQAMREHMALELIYQLETTVYTTLAPAFEAIQKKYQIPEEDRFKFPKFYGANLVKNEEAIVLEDLMEQGYTLYDRFKPVTWEYASKAVEELAKFHALSLSFVKDHPEQLNVLFSQQQPFVEVMYTMKAPIIEMVKSCSAITPEHLKERLEKFVLDFCKRESMDKYYGPSKPGFLVHSDYRASNILFKRQGGKIKHLIPVDYQSIHPGPAAVDLVYFIYSGTDEEFRRLHLNQLLDHYYNTISSFFRKIDIDPEQVYSRKDFDKDYRDMLGYGIYTAVTLLPIVLASNEDVPDLEKGMDSFIEVKSGDSFRKRFIPILNDFVKWGII